MDRLTVSDRRRVNAPSGGTTPPVFASTLTPQSTLLQKRPSRSRKPDELRKIFLKTGLIPTANGSAYLEQHPSPPSTSTPPSKFLPPTSSLKLTCSVIGPKPLPRSAPFSPHLVLTTSVKFAPFATRNRRGYIRDNIERDLGAHLETALRGVVIGERWPKSGVEVVVTVLEGEEDAWWGDEMMFGARGSGWGVMGVLAGCITAAGAAIVDAGIDCVDLVSGGVAGIVRDVEHEQQQKKKGKGMDKDEEGKKGGDVMVLDPCPSEHRGLRAACVVAYLATRDEITELWLKGDVGQDPEQLVEKAATAAVASRAVLADAVKEGVEAKLAVQPEGQDTKSGSGDVEMQG